MKIGIEINGVLRDTLKKIQQEYEKWYLNENWKEMKFVEDEKDIERKVISEVTSLNLNNHLYIVLFLLFVLDCQIQVFLLIDKMNLL